MAKQSIFVFARISPKPEHLADARSAVRSIVDQTRAEPGCRAFQLHDGIDDESLYLHEEWDDEAALADHYEQPYTQAVFMKYEAWLAQAVEITKLSPVS